MAAEGLAAAEKFEAAIPAYEAVRSQATPDSDEAVLVHHRLGLCYFRTGRYADSERELRNFLNQSAGSPLAAST